MLGNIIRGGQLTLHALRMFKQVSFYLFLWSSFVFLIFFALFIYDKTNSRMWQEYRDYQTANAMCHMLMCSKKVNIVLGKSSTQWTAGSVVDSGYFITAHDYIHKKAKESAISSLKISGGVLFLISIFLIYRGFRKTGEEFKRGARLGGFEKIRTIINKSNKKEKYDAYKIAEMPYPYLAERQHSFVIGANGTGKTILISKIVEQIRARGDKAVIYDKKGDYTKWFYDSKKDKILNPFDVRGESWSLLSEIENIVSVKQMAKAFIPEKESQGGDSKIWDEAGRLAFTEIVNKLHYQGESLSNREIVDRILKSTIKEVEKILKGTYGQSIVDSQSPRTASSVLFVLAAHFNSLKLANSKPGESFSIRDWVLGDEEDSMLFLTSQENLSGELAPLQTAWMEIVIGAILSKDADSNRKTWVIIDELPAINKIPSLGSALATVRSFGGCFILGMQNIAQLREVYGRNAAQNISSECNTRCIFQSNDSDTAKWMSENIGDIEVSEFKEGLSYGANTIRDGVNVSKQDKVKPILLPSEILNMSRLNLILKMPDHPAVKAKVRYKKRDKVEEPFEKNHQIVEDLKSAYDDVEEVTNESDDVEEGNNKKNKKISAGEKSTEGEMQFDDEKTNKTII